MIPTLGAIVPGRGAWISTANDLAAHLAGAADLPGTTLLTCGTIGWAVPHSRTFDRATAAPAQVPEAADISALTSRFRASPTARAGRQQCASTWNPRSGSHASSGSAWTEMEPHIWFSHYRR